MASNVVRKYITQDFSDEEKKSYFAYIKGDMNSTDWIQKAYSRREPLLLMNLQCNREDCNNWVSIRETGVCKCSNGHECYDVVIPAIEMINTD